MDYDFVFLFIMVQCLVPVETSGHLSVSCLEVLFLAATQEIDWSTYVARHNVPESHQLNGVLPPLEDLFSLQDILEK